MRLAEGRLDLVGRCAAGEHEPEVAVALGERHERPPTGIVMLMSETPGTARASSCPATSRSVPACGIGSIMTPAAACSRRSRPSSGTPARGAG